MGTKAQVLRPGLFIFIPHGRHLWPDWPCFLTLCRSPRLLGSKVLRVCLEHLRSVWAQPKSVSP